MQPPPRSRRVYLVRHAESDRLGAPVAMDPDLTARGLAQLDAMRARISELAIDEIVCSELVRARRTAAALARPEGPPPRVDPGWNEIHTVGDWRAHGARAVDELLQAPLYQPDDRRAIGESLRELYRRTQAAWQRLLALPGRSLLVVTHNGVLGALIPALMGHEEGTPRRSMIWYPHTAITELWLFDRDYDPALPQLFTLAVRIADAGHLPPELITR